jgi:hypothetical protein
MVPISQRSCCPDASKCEKWLGKTYKLEWQPSHLTMLSSNSYTRYISLAQTLAVALPIVHKPLHPELFDRQKKPSSPAISIFNYNF